jgi:hypothetical protein
MFIEKLKDKNMRASDEPCVRARSLSLNCSDQGFGIRFGKKFGPNRI